MSSNTGSTGSRPEIPTSFIVKPDNVITIFSAADFSNVNMNSYDPPRVSSGTAAICASNLSSKVLSIHDALNEPVISRTRLYAAAAE